MPVRKYLRQLLGVRNVIFSKVDCLTGPVPAQRFGSLAARTRALSICAQG